MDPGLALGSKRRVRRPRGCFPPGAYRASLMLAVIASVEMP